MISRQSQSTAIATLLATLLLPAAPLLVAAPANLPTPPQVWAKYDPDAGDFKEEIVFEETKDGIYYKDAYISAYVNGEEVRVYCKYAVKAGAKKAPGLMNVHGWYGTAFLDMKSVEDGWAVMSHDYSGLQHRGTPHTTKYPKALDHGRMNAELIYSTMPDRKQLTDPTATSHYLWNAVQRRVVSYLIDQKEVDADRIGAKGYSYGGTLMWNLAMDSRIKAVVAYFGIGWLEYYRNKGVWLYDLPPKNIPKTSGEELVLSAIAPEAHAPYIKAACLWLNGSNDHHGGHERGEQTFKMFQPGVPWTFAIQARGHHNTNKLGNDAKLWLEKYVLGKDIDWPARPKTEIRLDAQGVPEFVLSTGSTKDLQKVEAWYALKEPVSFGRHWRDAPLQRNGDTWVAKLPVANVDDYVFAFANLTYNGSYEGPIVISSDFTAAIPSKLGKAVATDTKAENLSDEESLWSDTAPVEGVGGIKGIRPLDNNKGMSCKRFNDPKWKAPKGASLSFKFYCTQPQTLILDAGNNFKTQIQITASDDWQSMVIPASQLRWGGNAHPLPDWSTVSTIAFNPAPQQDISKVIFAEIKWKPATP
jgi:dienelactone hydrolase